MYTFDGVPILNIYLINGMHYFVYVYFRFKCATSKDAYKASHQLVTKAGVTIQSRVFFLYIRN